MGGREFPTIVAAVEDRRENGFLKVADIPLDSVWIMVGSRLVSISGTPHKQRSGEAVGRNFSNEFYSQKMRCRAGVIYFLELIIVRELHPAPQLEGWLSRLLARFQPQDEIR